MQVEKDGRTFTPRVPWPIHLELNGLYVVREHVRCLSGVIVQLLEFEGLPEAMLLHSDITVTRQRSIKDVLGKRVKLRVLRLAKHSGRFADMSMHGVDADTANALLKRYKTWRDYRRRGVCKMKLTRFNWDNLEQLPDLIEPRTTLHAVCTGPDGILGIQELFKGYNICYLGDGLYKTQETLDWRELGMRAASIEGLRIEKR